MTVVADGVSIRTHRFGESVVVDVGAWRMVIGLATAEALARRLTELCTGAEHDQADAELGELLAGKLGPPRREPAANLCTCRCGPTGTPWQHSWSCPTRRP